MIICTILLLPLFILLQVVIPVVTQVIQTACAWVSSVLQVVQQVMSQVCSSLPWPFKWVCNWVTTFITVLQTVWNWVCNTVINTVITFIKTLVGVLIYVAQVVCILINIVVGFPALLLCLLRFNPSKVLRVCIKILTDEAGNSAVTPLAIQQNIARMSSAFEGCRVGVRVMSVEHIVKPEYLTTTDSSPSSIFSGWHLWFTQHACGCCGQVTVFVVDQIIGASGLTFWGDSWCRIDAACNSDDTIMAHEVGHLVNLGHSSDPNNVMYSSYSATAHHFTQRQCCLARRSPFVTYG